MATVQTIQVPGAGVITLGVYPLDHCDPHATCRDKTGLWTIRIDFSFVHDSVVLRDIVPASKAPAAHVIAALEQAVAANLQAFRGKWWFYQHGNPSSSARGACCLNNATVQGKTASSASYDPVNGKTNVALSDGSNYTWPP